MNSSSYGSLLRNCGEGVGGVGYALVVFATGLSVDFLGS